VSFVGIECENEAGEGVIAGDDDGGGGGNEAEAMKN